MEILRFIRRRDLIIACDELPIPNQGLCHVQYVEHDRQYTCVCMHHINTPEPYQRRRDTALALKFVYGPLPNPHCSYILAL
jgi:hypothetical protein